MPAASAQPLDDLLQQAAQSAGSTDEAADAVHAHFTTWSAAVDGAVWAGVLPIGFTLLILHEHYRSQVDGTPFRTGYVFARAGVLVGLLLGYPQLVRLITSVAGGWGEFVDWSDILGPVSRGGQRGLEQHSISHWQNTFDELPRFLFWLFLYGLVVVSSLFAMVATLLLTVSQGILVAMLVILGKPALVSSLVPGIRLGTSWARFLAMVAAWSTVGGTVASVILGHKYMQGADVLIALGNPKDMLFVAAHYAVFGIFTLAVPFVTGALFSGAIGGAPGVTAALLGGVMGARMVLSGGVGTTKSVGRVAGRALGRAGAGADRAVGAARGRLGIPRAHKVDRPPPDRGGAGPGGGPARGGRAPSGDRAPGKAARAAPRRVELPSGRPGAARFERAASAETRRAVAARKTAPPHQRAAPPPANAAMRARIADAHPTLRAAYPDLRWNPENPSNQERALVDELDAGHGRFAGWDRGAQGRGDLADARQIAAGRAHADTTGQAQPAPSYRPPPSAAPGGARPHPAQASAAPGAGRPGPARAPDRARPPAAARTPAAATSAAATSAADRRERPAPLAPRANAHVVRAADAPAARQPLRDTGERARDPDRTVALRAHKLERNR